MEKHSPFDVVVGYSVSEDFLRQHLFNALNTKTKSVDKGVLSRYEMVPSADTREYQLLPTHRSGLPAVSLRRKNGAVEVTYHLTALSIITLGFLALIGLLLAVRVGNEALVLGLVLLGLMCVFWIQCVHGVLSFHRLFKSR